MAVTGMIVPNGMNPSRLATGGHIHMLIRKGNRSLKLGRWENSTLSFKFVEIWECEWQELCKKLGLNPRGHDNLLHLEPLIPRDAYFGGRVNCTKLLFRSTG